jgi:hypothetical protein
MMPYSADRKFGRRNRMVMSLPVAPSKGLSMNDTKPSCRHGRLREAAVLGSR